ncbi:uncharacterized protein LOC142383795 [Odontesthes bonariensis]|uniref:uncharacterized protein LOC142383795 n=1 Tax=Odontesthes bonariensis TaxID=219752 RepID=UPI003F582709
MDSPGHCAQYCTYTTIEQDSRDMVHIVSVDKRETRRNSVIMEKECFVRMMDVLLQELSIKEVVTDAHPQITALLHPVRGKYKDFEILHSLDIWHAAKSLNKRLRRVGANHKDVVPWIKDIVNHFWYCSKHAKTVDVFLHSWVGGECDHLPLDEGSLKKSWLTKGGADHQALIQTVLDRRWLAQAKKFLNFRTTSDLENFQNHILMYASKRMSDTPCVQDPDSTGRH